MAARVAHKRRTRLADRPNQDRRRRHAGRSGPRRTDAWYPETADGCRTGQRAEKSPMHVTHCRQATNNRRVVAPLSVISHADTAGVAPGPEEAWESSTNQGMEGPTATAMTNRSRH